MCQRVLEKNQGAVSRKVGKDAGSVKRIENNNREVEDTLEEGTLRKSKLAGISTLCV